MAKRRREVPFPVRGAPGGWRDVWDDLDDSAALRAKAEAVERRQDAQAAILRRRMAREEARRLQRAGR